MANPFAKGGLARSPEQKQEAEPQRELQLGEQERREEQQKVEQEEQQQRVLQQQLKEPQQLGSGLLKYPKVEVAKKLVDELHEYVDKRHNVHKDIKELVTKIQGALGLAVKEWKAIKQKVQIAESELATTRNATASISQSVAKGATVKAVNTPLSTPKRTRTSPEETSQKPKKPKDDYEQHIDTVARVDGGTSGVNGGTQWQLINRRKEKPTKKIKEKERKFVKDRRKGEAIIVQTSDESYSEVLRSMRTAPELMELGADVQRIRRTQTGDMIFELKKGSKNSSSAYKELAEKIMGEKVKIKAMCPEATLQCRDIDEVTTEEELRSALKEQCELGEAQMIIRLRKGPYGMQVATITLPVDAANKALKVGKIKVCWSVCPLSISQRPEVCYRCQEFGHLARNCKGPDRTNLCRRCGEDGHKALDCKKPPKCMICSTDEGRNHVTGGPKCSTFKKAVATRSKWK